MLNPFGPQQDSGSYFDLQRRILQRVQAASVNDQIFEIVRTAYEHAIALENVVLARGERKLLLRQILRRVLSDMSNRLGGATAN